MTADPHPPRTKVMVGHAALAVFGMWLFVDGLLGLAPWTGLLGSWATSLGYFLLVLSLALLPINLAEYHGRDPIAARRLSGWLRIVAGVAAFVVAALTTGRVSDWVAISALLIALSIRDARAKADPPEQQR